MFINVKMRNSLKKLLRYNNEKREGSHIRDSNNILPLSPLDDLLKATQDMKDMRDCYDSLLSAASAATNTAYEFSDSARQMGVCLLQKISLSEDEEIGQVMLKLGKVQFEVQKNVDSYRSHIFQTITVPSESLINELNTVEEMKNQCDVKRELYEYMRAQYKEKGRSKSREAENFSLEELQAAKNDFDEEATLLVFRLKSLKQGQSRSLLTQAVRHHAAQLSFFRKALNALEAVEPHVKLITQEQHIDYQFSGLKDNESEDSDDVDVDEEFNNRDSSSEEDGGDFSSDYRQGQNLVSESRKIMEANVKAFDEDPYAKEEKMRSQSAPLYPHQRVDEAERMKQLRPSSTRKFHSYALPKPADTRKSTLYESVIPQAKSGLYHSSPLEPMKNDEQHVGSRNMYSGPIILNSNSILKENKMGSPSTQQLTPHTYTTSSIKKAKLQSFSGPLTFRTKLHKPSLCSNSPQHYSGPISISSMGHKSSSSIKVSPSTSPPFTSSSAIIISELHELPRPPMHAVASSSPKPWRSYVGFSGPLVTSKTSIIASPLPTPPLVGHSQFRSRSSPRNSSLTTSRSFQDVVSPPLTPIQLANEHPT